MIKGKRKSKDQEADESEDVVQLDGPSDKPPMSTRKKVSKRTSGTKLEKVSKADRAIEPKEASQDVNEGNKAEKKAAVTTRRNVQRRHTEDSKGLKRGKASSSAATKPAASVDECIKEPPVKTTASSAGNFQYCKIYQMVCMRVCACVCTGPLLPQNRVVFLPLLIAGHESDKTSKKRRLCVSNVKANTYRDSDSESTKDVPERKKRKASSAKVSADSKDASVEEIR